MKATRHRLSLFVRAPVLASVLALGGCASLDVSQPDLPTSIADFEEIQSLQDLFLAEPSALESLSDLQSYGNDVSLLWTSNSLRKGPLGTAMVGKYQGSFTGHYVLEKFYRTLGEPAADKHATWVNKITNHMTHGRDGSVNRPYRATDAHEARAFVRATGATVIGSMYGERENFPLVIYVLSRDDQGVVTPVFFEIQSYPRLRDLTTRPSEAAPIDVIRVLAGNQDVAAKVAYGAYLLENADADPNKRDGVVKLGKEWLVSSMQSQNAIPSYLMARFDIANRSKGIVWGDVERMLQRSIRLGHTEAMVSLGKLYLSGVFGDPHRQEGLTLLQGAIQRESVDAATTLGSMLYDSDREVALRYLRVASNHGGTAERLRFVRALVHPEVNRQVDEQAFGWMEELAAQDNQEGMLELAKIHAKGLYEDKVSLRKARRWYKRSVELAPTHGERVNEVAWILATTNIKRLRNPTLAIKYMDVLMSGNEEARQLPAYIDTWAAAYASKGDFHKAIELQREAVARAAKIQREDLADLLQAHLRDFEEGKALTEEVP